MKINLRKIVIHSLLLYLILTIIRTIGLLLINFSDNYFQELELNVYEMKDKLELYNLVFSYVPYAFLIVYMFVIFFLHQLKLIETFSILILSYLIFRLLDDDFLRPLFYYWDNIRINLFVHLALFLSFATLFYIWFKSELYEVGNESE